MGSRQTPPRQVYNNHCLVQVLQGQASHAFSSRVLCSALPWLECCQFPLPLIQYPEKGWVGQVRALEEHRDRNTWLFGWWCYEFFPVIWAFWMVCITVLKHHTIKRTWKVIGAQKSFFSAWIKNITAKSLFKNYFFNQQIDFSSAKHSFYIV